MLIFTWTLAFNVLVNLENTHVFERIFGWNTSTISCSKRLFYCSPCITTSSCIYIITLCLLLTSAVTQSRSHSFIGLMFYNFTCCGQKKKIENNSKLVCKNFDAISRDSLAIAIITMTKYDSNLLCMYMHSLQLSLRNTFEFLYKSFT